MLSTMIGSINSGKQDLDLNDRPSSSLVRLGRRWCVR